MQCSFVINQVRQKLNDPSKVTWSDTVLINALNEALQALVSYRPDAASYTTMMLLVAGTRQTNNIIVVVLNIILHLCQTVVMLQKLRIPNIKTDF